MGVGMYRLVWEMVDIHQIDRFDNVPSSQIPDEYWHEVVRETDDPWDQCNTLRTWADADIEQVRNVRLYKMREAPIWDPVNE